MVKDAELHAAEDKKRRELIDAKNQGEALIHSTEKSIAEYGDKVSAADRSAVEGAIAALRPVLEGEDVEAIKARTNEVMQASMKLGEAMYKASAAAGDAAPGTDEHNSSEDVIDADFKEVGEDDKKRRA